MKARLTERQNQAYEFIRGYVREHRKPPTLADIGRALGIRSSNGVWKLLLALEQKGYIRREKHAARGIQLVEAEDAYAFDEGVPSLLLVSRTRSDRPDLLRHRPRGALNVDPRLLGDAEEEACLIGRAGDDGMNGDGIRKGDFLVLEEVDPEALRSGEVVAVLVGEALLARRFDFANGRYHLRPADRTYAEEAYAPDDPECYVVGRVLSVMRKL
ncbi:MAG: S24 family peptidase [Rhodothermales bacterium]|nr:S24 family peptidase [Rhodothermales bacterium]